jgi:hypothetical protein
MTIGILLKFSEFNNGKENHGIIAIADRMVSFGAQGIEYPISKIDVLSETQPVVVGVGSGYDFFITEFFDRTRTKIKTSKSKKMNDLAKEALNSYLEIIQERVETQVLGPFGLKLKDIRSPNFNENLYRSLYSKSDDIIGEITRRGLDIIIGGCDDSGSHLWSISDLTRMNESKIGFSVTGSGSGSAEWTVIHKNFDQTKGMIHALVIGLAAKFQAEESLGVGSKTEVKIIRPKKAIQLNDDSIDKIRELVDEENKRQKEALEKTINKIIDYGVEKNDE